MAEGKFFLCDFFAFSGYRDLSGQTFYNFLFRMITILGLFCIPTAWHILIMTFMNAKVNTIGLLMDFKNKKYKSLYTMFPFYFKFLN